MSNFRLVLCLLITIITRLTSAASERMAISPPRVFLLDAGQLMTAKERLRKGDQTLQAPLRKLELDAKKALNAGPFSVTYKGATPLSGDKHDYMSQAPYFWPNPTNSNASPYVRRDGERNPEINKLSDHRSMNDMADSVETLALAYYFTGEEAYAARAAELLRAWFLDPTTRMNPNFQYAQAIPGLSSGRGIGLIESRAFTHVVDAAGLLANSRAGQPGINTHCRSGFAAFCTGCSIARMDGTNLRRKIITAPFTTFKQLPMRFLSKPRTWRVPFFGPPARGASEDKLSPTAANLWNWSAPRHGAIA